jgi:hypothetical protein
MIGGLRALQEDDRVDPKRLVFEQLVQRDDDGSDEGPIPREGLGRHQHESRMASPRCPVPLIKGGEVLDVGRYQCVASRCGRRKHLLVRQGSHRAVLYRGHDIVAARSELSCDRAAQHLIKEKRGCHELAGEQIALASPHGLCM